MKYKFGKRFYPIFALFLTALIAIPWAVFADDLTASGDGISTSGNNTTLSFGAVCPNTSVTKDSTLAISRSSNSNSNTYANSSNVAITVGSPTVASGDGTLGVSLNGDTNVTLPSDWVSKSNSFKSTDTVLAKVTLNAKTSAGTGSVLFTARGTAVNNSSLEKTLSLNISWSIASSSSCDTTPPVLSLPSNITAEATSASGAAVTYTASAFDAGDNAATAVTCSSASGATFPIGTTTVNCSSKDSKNNTATGSFSITVQDTLGPVISGTPSNMTVGAVDATGAVVNYTAPTATDVVDGVRTVTCTPASGSKFSLGQTTVDCSASDAHGHTNHSFFVIDVKDQTAPVLSLPGPITAEATSSSGAAVPYTASATDNVDGSVAPTCSPASGSTFALGTKSVTCSAKDAAGNANSGSFNVTVQDKTPPDLTVPSSAIIAEATGASGANVTYTASASDKVDGAVSPSCSPASGSIFALGQTAVNCSAIDAHGNSASASFNIVVVDSTAPALSLAADQVLEATGPSGAAAIFATSAADVVDGAVTVSCVNQSNQPVASGALFPIGTTTVTCSATDAHGNRAQGSLTIKVQDTTLPTLTLPVQAVVAEATGPAGAVVTYDATADDVVDGTFAPSCSAVSGAMFPLGSTTVTCTAKDKAGNMASGSFTVTVRDTTEPDIPLSLGAIDAVETSGGAKINYATPSATDLVDGSVVVSCSPASGSVFLIGTATVTCSAEDSHGNKAVREYTFEVQDANAPVLSLPAPIIEEATGATGAIVMYNVSADDVVSGPVSPSCTPAAGSTFAIGTTTVNCTATDPSKNTAKGSFTVTVHDTTKPKLTVPADITVEATGKNGAPVSYQTSASDIVDGSVGVSCTPASGATYPLGETTITCSATDKAGNKAEENFVVTVQDTTKPSLNLPANISVEAAGPDGTAVDYTTSATDVVDGNIIPACSIPSGSTFPLGTTTVACSASDAHDNTASGSFTVTVLDTTAPSLKLPTPVTAEATGPDGAQVGFTATADDIVDGSVLVVCNNPSGSTFALGATTVSCLAEDAHHNKAQDYFTVTVVDTTAPDINGELADLAPEATGPSGATVSYTSPSANDLVDGTVAVTCSPASGSIFVLGTTTVTCSAADSHGNTARRNFKINVQDTTAPVLSLPQDITEEATSSAGAAVNYQATATDVVDGAVTPTCSQASGSTFVVGTTTVNCSAKDNQGNTSSGSFGITVRDTTPPVLTVPGNVKAEATGPKGAAVTYSVPEAIDIVDGAIVPTCDIASGSTFAIQETTVNCSATDAHGNKASGSFTVEVVDTTAPSLTQPANITAEATGRLGAAVTFDVPTATDTVDGSDAVTCNPASGTTFGPDDTEVTCSAADAHRNGASVSFKVKVIDTTAPALTLPADITKEATSGQGALVGYKVSATDLLDGASAPMCSKGSDETFALGTTKVTCSATDGHGNTASGSFNVTVQDTTPPTIVGTLANVNAEATSGQGASVSYSVPTAEDLVDESVALTCSPASGSVFPLGLNTVTCSATDKAGNKAEKSFTVDIQDNTAPVLELANVTAEATSAAGAAVAYQANANDIVDGLVTPSCTPASGATFALGTTTVNCSAKDKQNNTNSGSFTVTVRDTTPPSLGAMPSNITAEATSATGAAVSFAAPSATDVVDGSVIVTCSKAGGLTVKSGDTFPLGTTTVNCLATDGAGNKATGSFNITVKDTTAPSLALPANITVVPTSSTGANLSYAASASDKVDGAITPTCTPASGSLFGLGTTTVTCSATDAHNNTFSGSFRVTVTFSSWSGVLQPINTNGSSIFNQGSTIPVKFQLTGASAKITNAVVKLYVKKISISVAGSEQEAVSTSAANIGNTFRYDPTSNQYIFNLATKGLSVGTYQLRIDFGDGVNNTVNISLK